MNEGLIDKLIKEVKNIVKDKINNIKQKLKSFFSPLITLLDNFLEHKLRYTILLIILSLVVISLVYLIYLNIHEPLFSLVNVLENNTITDQLILIKGISLDNIYTFLGVVIILITAMWAMFQYDKSRKEKQQEKASLIAKRFSSGLLKDLAIISSVLSDEEFIKKHSLSINMNTLEDFNLFELSEIFGDQTELIIKDYKEVINSSIVQEKYKNFLKNHYEESEIKEFPSKFTALIENSLNELEYLCMDITSSAADSKYIYQSLHQIFLRTIHILHIYISSLNGDNIDTYYTNIINVYKLWIQFRKSDEKKLFKTRKKILKLENKSKTEIKKLLKKKSNRI